MTITRKKLAAVSAAVFTYIKTEEEAALFAAQQAGDEPLPQPETTAAGAKANVWGSCGRSEMMQIRTMMQMRAFK